MQQIYITRHGGFPCNKETLLATVGSPCDKDIEGGYTFDGEASQGGKRGFLLGGEGLLGGKEVTLWVGRCYWVGREVTPCVGREVT